MSGITLDKLIFDPAAVAEGPTIGSYVIGAAGDVVTTTTTGPNVALDVNVISGADDGVFAEDSVAADGANGQSILKVRQDTLSSLVNASGDYEWFKGDARGALWVNPVGDVADDSPDNERPVKVGSRAVSGALAAVSTTGDRADLLSDMYRRVWINDSPNIGVASVAVSVDNTVGGVALPTTAQVGRRRVLIQNRGSGSIFVGPSGVTAADGIEVFKNSTMALEVGQNIALFGIAASGTHDTRVFELA